MNKVALIYILMFFKVVLLKLQTIEQSYLRTVMTSITEVRVLAAIYVDNRI